jgi:hypothetical protein
MQCPVELSWTSSGSVKAFARSEGIKGTQTAKAKHLPVEKREAGPKDMEKVQ